MKEKGIEKQGKQQKIIENEGDIMENMKEKQQIIEKLVWHCMENMKKTMVIVKK